MANIYQVQNITDKVFNVFITVIDYGIKHQFKSPVPILSTYDDSYIEPNWYADTNGSKYFNNNKNYYWELDWQKYYDLAAVGNKAELEYIEKDINRLYKKTFRPIIKMAKDEIVAKYESKNAELVPIVKKILDTVRIDIRNHSDFNYELGACLGIVKLHLEAVKPE